MKSTPTIDPQVAALFELASLIRPAPGVDTPAQRQIDAQLADLADSVAPPTPLEGRIDLTGPAGPIPARVFWPAAKPDGEHPLVVYLHGGGYVVGDVDSYVHVTRELCRECAAIVVSVDYRLAPEHPYPAPVEDCLAATRAVRDRARELGGDPRKLFVIGDSAGANAAASVALRLRDSGDLTLAGLVLMCPWLDMSLSSGSFRRFVETDPVMDEVGVRYCRDAFLAGHPETDPLVSPVLADLHGLPPVRLVLGEVDPLLDEGIEFAARLEACGVTAEVHVCERMPHDFVVLPFVEMAIGAFRGVGQFVQRLAAETAAAESKPTMRRRA